MKISIFILTALIVVSTTSIAQAHSGRRLEIMIHDSQLVAQGYISGSNPTDDGGGLVRPYFNAVHSHWGNVGPVAIADLPGFDLHSPVGLMGYDLTLALTGAGKWSDPMNNMFAGEPVLSPLDLGETINVGFGAQTDIDTDTLGSFLIADNIAGPVMDIDLNYSIFINPVNTLYYLQWQLSTNAPGVGASQSIYTIFAPDPSATSGLHHRALMLESYLGIAAVPEPSAVSLLALASIGMIGKRRRR